VGRIGIRGGPGLHDDRSWDALARLGSRHESSAHSARKVSDHNGTRPSRGPHERMAIRCEGTEFAAEIVIKAARTKLNAVVTHAPLPLTLRRDSPVQ